MDIKIICPSCGNNLVVDSATSGQQTICPQCSTSFVVPVMAQVAPPPSVERKCGMAVTSMVLGIASLVMFCLLLGIPAIILGHIAHGRARKRPAEYDGGGMAITGFVTGYVSLVMSLMVVPILLAMLLPALAAAKHKAQEINSMNNLKQIGLAFSIWEGDHNDQYPFNVSEAQGGTLELCNPDSDGFEKNPAPVFMVMSNELATPNILVCPNDPVHQAATNFASLTVNNISYQLRTGTNINSSDPQAILVVDPINGYVLKCDGSVQKDLHYKK